MSTTNNTPTPAQSATPTPRTDSQIAANEFYTSNGQHCLTINFAILARTLERELAAMTSQHQLLVQEKLDWESDKAELQRTITKLGNDLAAVCKANSELADSVIAMNSTSKAHERARETAEKILHIANYYHERGSDMSDEHAASIILAALTAATADLRAEVAGLRAVAYPTATQMDKEPRK
jgi:hypothetical protein